MSADIIVRLVCVRALHDGGEEAAAITDAIAEIERLCAENETLRLDAEMDGSMIRSLRAENANLRRLTEAYNDLALANERLRALGPDLSVRKL